MLCGGSDCEEYFPELCDCDLRKRSVKNQQSIFKRSTNSSSHIHDKSSTNSSSQDNCLFSVITAVCRKKLNATYSSYVTAPTPASSMAPMPTPCESSQCNFGYSLSELLYTSLRLVLSRGRLQRCSLQRTVKHRSPDHYRYANNNTINTESSKLMHPPSRNSHS